MIWFGVVALCFVTTTSALRSVLGKIFVIVLLCHSSECGFCVCDDCALEISPVTSIPGVKRREKPARGQSDEDLDTSTLIQMAHLYHQDNLPQQ